MTNIPDSCFREKTTTCTGEKPLTLKSSDQLRVYKGSYGIR